MKFYVYRHIRLDTGKPFYVGKGSGKRANNRATRNDYWKHIVAKADYRVEIVKRFESEAEAFAFERTLVGVYKSFGFCEANLNGGGEGGYEPSEETRAKWKLQRSGEGNAMYGKPHSEETKRKIAEKAKGRPGVVTRGMLGKKMPEEAKRKIQKWHDEIGENHPQFKGWWVTPLGRFVSKRQAAKAHGCAPCVVSQRCILSTSERFKDWYFEPKESKAA